jgi:formylmethanofuran dehydrogenase subunit E
MVKFPEAEARKFHGVFVCKRCKTKIKSSPMKVADGKLLCRKCKSKAFRTVRKK